MQLLGGGGDALRQLALVLRQLTRRWILFLIVAAVVAVQLCVLMVRRTNLLAEIGSNGSQPAPNAVSPSGKINPMLCSDIPVPAEHWTTRASHDSAFVEIPGRNSIIAGQSVCVRVVVPAMPIGVLLTYVPFPDTPWDSVLLDMVGRATGISVPVHLQPVMDIRNTLRNSTHVYEANVVLRDADVYSPQGHIEFRNARWNPEDGLSPAPYSPEKLRISDGLRVAVEDRNQQSPYSLARYLELPLCTTLDPDGRWIPVDLLPFNATQLPLPDDANRVWLPYQCRLRRIGYREYGKCLAQKHPIMHWYGDSNLRRSLKKITTLGSWCSSADDRLSKSCSCEDYQDDFEPFDPSKRENMLEIDSASGGRTVPGDTVAKKIPPAKAYIAYRKWEGLSSRNSPGWEHMFLKNRITRQYGQPSILVISLTNWDAAYSNRVGFATNIELLLQFLGEQYTDKTEIIIRTGQYFCCRSDNDGDSTRNYSRKRNAYFDNYIIRAFEERFGQSRKLSIWNVAAISERRPIAARWESTTCKSNHVRADIVEIENQALFNYMCN